MKNLNRKVDIKIYDDAGHGFANSDNLDSYRPDVAADAWITRTLAFLAM